MKKSWNIYVIGFWMFQLPIGFAQGGDLSTSKTSRQNQKITFCDPNFENLILEQFDINRDGELSMGEALMIESITLIQVGIKDVREITFFENIIYFDCSFNEIKNLPDLSHNNKLVWLNCSFNDLETLPRLPMYMQILNCSNNKLKSLDSLENLDLLSNLHVENNQLENIPSLSDNLLDFSGDGNQFSDQSFPSDFWSLPNLQSLTLRSNKLEVIENVPPNLRFFYVDNNNIFSLPKVLPATLWQFSCSNNNLNRIPDLSGELQSLDISNNPLQVPPDLGKLPDLSWFFASKTNLTDPTTLAYPSGLELLHIYDNPLGPGFCELVESLQSELHGIPPLYLDCKGFDGLVFEPLEDGSFMECNDLMPGFFPTELYAFKKGARVQLGWSSWNQVPDVDQGMGRSLSHFDIYRDHNLVGATRENRFSFQEEALQVDYEFEVVPIFKDGSSGESGKLTYSERSPSYHQYFLHIFKSLEDKWLGTALFNPLDETASYLMIIRDLNGRQLKQTTTFKLPPKAKHVNLLDQVFSDDDLDKAYLLEVRSTKELGFVGLSGSSDGRVMNSAGTKWSQSGWISTVNLEQNPLNASFYTEKQAELHVKGYSFEGDLVEEVTLNLNSLWQGEMRSIFETKQGVVLLNWNSDQPVVSDTLNQMESLNSINSEAWNFIPGLYGVLPITRNFAYKIRANETHLHNPNSSSNLVRLQHFDVHGEWEQESVLELKPFETRILPTSFLFFRGSGTELVIFEASQPVMVRPEQSLFVPGVVYKSDTYGVISNLGHQLMVPHFAKPPTWETRVQIVNPHDEVIHATVEAFTEMGTLSHSFQMEIPAFQHIDLDTDFPVETASLIIKGQENTLGGVVTYSNFQDLASYVLTPLD